MAEIGNDISIQNIYAGKIVTIWIAWRKGFPEQYVIGKTKQEVIHLIKQNPRINTYHLIAGGCLATSPDYPKMEGAGSDVAVAIADLMYQINLRNGIITWEKVIGKIVRGDVLDPVELKAVDRLREELKE